MVFLRIEKGSGMIVRKTIGAAALVFFSVATHAATWTVNDPGDSGDCGAPDAGTLRHAVCNAEDNDVITFADSMNIILSDDIEIEKNITIDGTGHEVIVDGNETLIVFEVGPWNPVSFNLKNLKVTGGSQDGITVNSNSAIVVENSEIYENGAAIFLDDSTTAQVFNSRLHTNSDAGVWIQGSTNLEVENSSIHNNTGDLASGILFFDGAGTISLASSEVYGNAQDGISATSASQALKIEIDNSAIYGNQNDGVSVGGNTTLEVKNSSLTTNQKNGISASEDATVEIINSTIAKNDEIGFEFSNVVEASATHTTLAGNEHGEAAIVPDSGTPKLKLKNSLIVGQCTGNNSNTEYFEDLGGNIDTSNTCDLNSGFSWPGIEIAALELGALNNHGGMTAFILPGEGSFAIDKVECLENDFAEDQRGVLRPQGEKCDVGAIEVLSGDGDDDDKDEDDNNGIGNPQPKPVPTLGQWALFFLTGLLGLTGARRMHSKG